MTDQAAVPAAIADYAHNDLGQRVAKDLGAGQVTHFHYDRSGLPRYRVGEGFSRAFASIA